MRTRGGRALIQLAALVTVAACGRGESEKSAPPVPATSDSAKLVAAGPTCPADGKWHECSVIYRLERAGLAPVRDSVPVTEKPLARPGILVRLGRAELELFIYSDEAARAADERKLDTAQFVEPSEEPTIRRERTMIRSVNLLGLLKSLNSHQRERVSDALTAGPPQPPA